MALYINKEKEDLISVALLKALWDYNCDTGIFTRLITTGPKAKKGSIADSVCDSGYIIITLNGNKYRAHRLAWLYCFNEFPDFILDHDNGIKSDNAISNLREATLQENAFNQIVRSDNTTGYKGVSIDKRSGRYRAYITINNKQTSLGYYSTPEEASIAYNTAAKELHGEFYKDISK